jgi:formylglycine-generating enzyme required for sulfatase activity
MNAKKKGRWLVLLLGLVVAIGSPVAVWAVWPYLRLWYYFEPLGPNAKGCFEYRHRETGIVFVRVPGGSFRMGAQRDHPAAANHDPVAQTAEGPVRQVVLRPFLIAKFELTQAEWQAVVPNDPSSHIGGNLPVDSVSWDDCQAFCLLTGLQLPTEAQWEYACRARSTDPFCFGKDPDVLGEFCWYAENSGGITHPVGRKRPNGFGLHDVHGNVWEWCQDVWDGKFYSQPEATKRDPVATSGSNLRILRGGSRMDPARVCRSAMRFRDAPTSRRNVFGFRPAASGP